MLFLPCFVMLWCTSVSWCLVVTCWERADLLALICDVLLCSCDFPIGILGQVWCLIVSIPDLCPLSYFVPDAGLCSNCLFVYDGSYSFLFYIIKIKSLKQ